MTIRIPITATELAYCSKTIHTKLIYEAVVELINVAQRSSLCPNLQKMSGAVYPDKSKKKLSKNCF